MENMYIRDLDGEKQRINLSDEAWAVIDDDMRNFYTLEGERSFSGFMNTVFANFYERADATFSSRKSEYRAELQEMLMGIGRQSEIISRLTDGYIKKLKTAAFSYPKGYGKYFRLNKESQGILDGHPDSPEYDSRSDYLKAVFEQYATLLSFERERIFFKDKIDAINNATALGKRLRITLLPRPEDNGAKFIYSVKPYDVRQDRNQLFNYLVGYSERLDNSHEPMFPDTERAVRFRISRIKDIRVTAQNSFISKDRRDEIEKTMREKGVQFMSGDLMDITVKFTDKGLDDFNRQSYMRPRSFDKVDNAKNTYVFYCTMFQAFNYFFKLGAEAQILSPTSLRDAMRNRFEEAANAYN